MALTSADRILLERCLAREPKAWEDFVDRFLGLVVHVVHHSAQSRSITLPAQDIEDLSAEVFLGLIRDDFAVLRKFRGESSLATYLTVVSRRIIVRELLKTRSVAAGLEIDPAASTETSEEERISDQEEVARLLSGLDGNEAAVVRQFHLEGKSYQQISKNLNLPMNSIGPMLSRAREKMRNATPG